MWAAARTLPETQRAEFGRELRERIGDVIDARVERGAAPADAEHAALVELGDPVQLAVELHRPAAAAHRAEATSSPGGDC